MDLGNICPRLFVVVGGDLRLLRAISTGGERLRGGKGERVRRRIGGSGGERGLPCLRAPISLGERARILGEYLLPPPTAPPSIGERRLPDGGDNGGDLRDKRECGRGERERP